MRPRFKLVKIHYAPELPKDHADVVFRPAGGWDHIGYYSDEFKCWYADDDQIDTYVNVVAWYYLFEME